MVLKKSKEDKKSKQYFFFNAFKLWVIPIKKYKKVNFFKENIPCFENTN
jgi:hypothetical protein